MLRFITATLASVIILIGAAHADVTIATGKAGGGYDKAAQAIAQRLEQRGISAAVANYDGSDAISLAICGGRAAIGPMQIDAVWARAQEGCDLKAIGTYGNEYAVLLVPPGGAKDELSDFGPADAILADTIGSGSDLWLRTAIRIENGDDGSNDKWAEARVVNDPLALAQASAEIGDIQGVVMVRKPNDPGVLRLLENGWTLGYLWDKDIDDLKFKGKPLYEAKKVEISAAGKKFRNWGYEVRSLIVAGKPIVDGDRSIYSAITAAVAQ